MCERAYIISIDYGLNEKDLFYNGKKKSNVSVIHNHSFYDNYFYKPGYSDITFQVDINELLNNFENIKELYNLAHQNNLILFTAFNKRYDPEIINLYKMYRSGKLGKASQILFISRELPYPYTQEQSIENSILRFYSFGSFAGSSENPCKVQRLFEYKKAEKHV